MKIIGDALEAGCPPVHVRDEVDELRNILDFLHSERIESLSRANLGYLLLRSPAHQHLLKLLEGAKDSRTADYLKRYVSKGEYYG